MEPGRSIQRSLRLWLQRCWWWRRWPAWFRRGGRRGSIRCRHCELNKLMFRHLPQAGSLDDKSPTHSMRIGATLPCSRQLGHLPVSSVPYWRRFARNYGTTNARFYSSDFGSDLFIGDFVLSRESSSCEQAGTPTLPSRMISFALSFLP